MADKQQKREMVVLKDWSTRDNPETKNIDFRGTTADGDKVEVTISPLNDETYIKDDKLFTPDTIYVMDRS